MKTKQPARRRPRRASAQELERDAQEQLAYLDRYKPRPRKTTAEEAREAQAQLAYLDQYKPRQAKRHPAMTQRRQGGTAEQYEDGQRQIAYLDERDALTNNLWRELVAHLRRGNLTAAHYLLTSPACLGSFIPGGGPQPPAEVKKALGKLGIKGRQDLHEYLDNRIGEARGKVLVRVLQDLAGACLYAEMLALLPFAREALAQVKDLRLEHFVKGKAKPPKPTNAAQAVAICGQAIARVEMETMQGAHEDPGHLITLRRGAAGLKTRPAKTTRRANKQDPF